MAQTLVALGADVQWNSPGDVNALYVAVRAGHLPIVEYLWGLCSPAQQQEKIRGCCLYLVVAVSQKHFDVADFLLAAGADMDGRLIGTVVFFGIFHREQILTKLGGQTEARC